MKTRYLMVIVIGCLLGTSVSLAQSLGDYARKMRAQEAAHPKPAKVYTNDDIPRGATITEPAPQAVPAASGENAKPQEPSTTGNAAAAEPGQSAESEKPAEDKARNKDYWQGKYNDAKAKLDRAEEEFKLSEDEMNLAQMNQARELDPDKKTQLDQELKGKQAAAEAKRAAYQKAQQAMEDLKKDFAASGAPKDWWPSDEKP